MGHSEPDVVIVGAGIAGGALGTVLARASLEVVLLERENSYPNRVRGEYAAPWGVTELAKLELLQPLHEANGLFTRRMSKDGMAKDGMSKEGMSKDGMKKEGMSK
jgi:2-polyprenyl-6-methoxyphenol hydroxylase-like FAD-dependent oxidoreductase